jgi:hypothetical protein
MGCSDSQGGQLYSRLALRSLRPHRHRREGWRDSVPGFFSLRSSRLCVFIAHPNCLAFASSSQNCNHFGCDSLRLILLFMGTLFVIFAFLAVNSPIGRANGRLFLAVPGRDFGFRISDFLRISDFGFRISGLRPCSPPATRA